MAGYEMASLLQGMDARGASDPILTAGTAPQYRILGLLEPAGPEVLGADDCHALALSLLGDAQRARLEETRGLDCSHTGIDGRRYRLSLYYQRDTLALAARLIPDVIPSFAELGLPTVVAEFALLPHGLVLVTGPAGSGKSTTLAALIDHLNTHRPAHVICIEDPIEYLHRHRRATIAQREIGSDARSFAEALRSVFRQTPDVIMVGELRDLETMQLALTLAETGHLILATLHTQDTTHSVNRLVDCFPPAQQAQVYLQLSLVLMGVVSQQLIRTADGARRVLACEILRATPAVRNLIREAELQQLYSVVQTGRAEGMVTMNESLLQLCQLGFIDEATALGRSPRPRELRQLLEHRRRGGRP